MKKLLIGLTLLLSISASAETNILTIPSSLNSDSLTKTMDVNKIQSLIDEAGELASVECEKRDSKALSKIAMEIGAEIRPHAGHDQFQTALVAQQRIHDKSLEAMLCQQ